MNTLTNIDALALSTVNGGADTEIGGTVKTPAVEVTGQYNSNERPERRSNFTTGVNDFTANCSGWVGRIFGASNACMDRAVNDARGLKGSPTNPE